MTRKPSCLISCSHKVPEGGRWAFVGRQGWMNPAGRVRGLLQPSGWTDQMTASIGRREFITLCGGAAASWPLGARAQQSERMRRIGVLMHRRQTSRSLRRASPRSCKDFRNQGGPSGATCASITAGAWAIPRASTAELVALAPEVILGGVGATAAALQQATRTVPVVMAQGIDPVGNGYLESLAQPGGNITGFLQFEYSLAGKWMELLAACGAGAAAGDWISQSGDRLIRRAT